MADVILGTQNNGAGFSQTYNNNSSQKMDTNSTLVYTANDTVKEVGVWQDLEPDGPVQVHISIYDISGGVSGAPLIYTTTIDSDVGTGAGIYLTKALPSDVLPGLIGGEVLALQMGWSSGGTFRTSRVTSSSTSLSAASPGSTPLDPWVQDSSVSTQTPDAYFILGASEAGASFTITDSLGDPSDVAYQGETYTVDVANAGGATYTSIRLTGPDNNPLTLSLTPDGSVADRYTFTAPNISEVEGSQVQATFPGTGTATLIEAV